MVNDKRLIVASDSLCLAVTLSIYLSVFESWFVLSKRSDEKEWEKSRSIKITDEAILSVMPLFVFVFYPFQHFGVIYLVGFVFGHFFAAYYWCNKVCLQRNYHKSDDISGLERVFKRNEDHWKYARAIFGLCTLAILVADKVWASLAFDSALNYGEAPLMWLLSTPGEIAGKKGLLGGIVVFLLLSSLFLWRTKKTLSCVRFFVVEITLSLCAWFILAFIALGDFSFPQSRLLYAMAGLLTYATISFSAGVVRICVVFDKNRDLIKSSFQNMKFSELAEQFQPIMKLFKKGE